MLADRVHIMYSVRAYACRAAPSGGSREARHGFGVAEGIAVRPLTRNNKTPKQGPAARRQPIHHAPTFVEAAQMTIAAHRIRIPKRMYRTACDPASRHSPRRKPMTLATRSPMARLSGQPIDGPMSPSRGVAAPYKQILPPQSNP